jgi:hypothetical protein
LFPQFGQGAGRGVSRGPAPKFKAQHSKFKGSSKFKSSSSATELGSQGLILVLGFLFELPLSFEL